nr:MAG TPA: hypothetical protein [Caudoviricetes sp.]
MVFYIVRIIFYFFIIIYYKQERKFKNSNNKEVSAMIQCKMNRHGDIPQYLISKEVIYYEK